MRRLRLPTLKPQRKEDAFSEMFIGKILWKQLLVDIVQKVLILIHSVNPIFLTVSPSSPNPLLSPSRLPSAPNFLGEV